MGHRILFNTMLKQFLKKLFGVKYFNLLILTFCFDFLFNNDVSHKLSKTYVFWAQEMNHSINQSNWFKIKLVVVKMRITLLTHWNFMIKDAHCCHNTLYIRVKYHPVKLWSRKYCLKAYDLVLIQVFWVLLIIDFDYQIWKLNNLSLDLYCLFPFVFGIKFFNMTIDNLSEYISAIIFEFWKICKNWLPEFYKNF
jgi:hypothetical protein